MKIINLDYLFNEIKTQWWFVSQICKHKRSDYKANIKINQKKKKVQLNKSKAYGLVTNCELIISRMNLNKLRTNADRM